MGNDPIVEAEIRHLIKLLARQRDKAHQGSLNTDDPYAIFYFGEYMGLDKAIQMVHEILYEEWNR